MGMKFGMLDDVLTVLDLEKYLTGTEVQIGGFDLLYRDGLRYAPPHGAVFSSYLGCANNRLSQLERLAKERAWELGKEGGKKGSDRSASPCPEENAQRSALRRTVQVAQSAARGRIRPLSPPSEWKAGPWVVPRCGMRSRT